MYLETVYIMRGLSSRWHHVVKAEQTLKLRVRTFFIHCNSNLEYSRGEMGEYSTMKAFMLFHFYEQGLACSNLNISIILFWWFMIENSS